MPAPEWARIANTTIHQYIRDEELNILRNRKLLAMMKDRGRISMNSPGGDFMDWKVKYKRAPMQGYADTDTLTFSRRNKWQTAQLEWRGYSATDSITKLERLKNQGQQAIIKIASTIMESLMDDMDDQFGDELYIDGNASGNSKRIHGIESFMGNSGAASGGFIGTPSDTYAGLSTTLANYGGTWTGNWPAGYGDAHYDFWSPLILDYTDTSWTAATKTWPNTCKEVLRYATINTQRNKSKKGETDMFLLEKDMYRQLLDALDAAERLTVKRGDGKNGLYSLGFTDVVNLNGVDISSEYGVPANVGYGFNMNFIELRSLQSQLFVSDDIDFDIASQSDRFAVSFFGNCRFNPRYFCKLMSIT